MSKKANRTLTGIFVLSSLTLIIGTLIVLGSGRFFTENPKFVLFFENSVKGLKEGAPVMFRGVKVGTVSEILLTFDPSDMFVNIPVIIEIEKNRIIKEDDGADSSVHLMTLIDKGLTAQLQVQSIVTGLLMINFDFYPDKEPRLLGIKNEYPEIPTVPSRLAELEKRFDKLPVDEIMNKLVSAIDGVEKLVNSPDIRKSFLALDTTLSQIQLFLKDTEVKTEKLESSFTGAADAAKDAFIQAEKTLSLQDGESAKLAQNLNETISTLKNTLDETSIAVRSIEQLMTGDSEVVFQLNNTLKEISSAARSVRFLADYLDRHPEAILKGKRKQKGE